MLIRNHSFFVTLSRSAFQDPYSITPYLEIDESSGPRVFEIRFSWLSAFWFGIFRKFSTPKSRDRIKSNHHLKSIDLVEISRSVVESSNIDTLWSPFVFGSLDRLSQLSDLVFVLLIFNPKLLRYGQIKTSPPIDRSRRDLSIGCRIIENGSI